MEYLSKSFRLDAEVVKWLDSLKMQHGSVNKGLRAVMAARKKQISPLADVDAALDRYSGPLSRKLVNDLASDDDPGELKYEREE